MRISFFRVLALIGAMGFARASAAGGIRVDFDLPKESGHREVIVRITNHSTEELELQHPSLHHILSFIVMSRTGARCVPEGIAKSDPRGQRLRLAPNETYDYTVAHWTTDRSTRGLHYFPFLTGTGLFGYRLEPGGKYRVIAVYRPFGTDQDGVCSPEKLVEIAGEADEPVVRAVQRDAPSASRSPVPAPPPSAHRTPRLSPTEAVTAALAHLEQVGVDVDSHMIYMVDAMSMTSTPFWRITWILRVPEGSNRIYADVRDDGKVTHLIRDAKPPATELVMPELSLADAVAAVRAYVSGHPGVFADNVLKRVSLTDLEARPCWHFSWIMRERVKGGGVFLSVDHVGKIKVTFGE